MCGSRAGRSCSALPTYLLQVLTQQPWKQQQPKQHEPCPSPPRRCRTSSTSLLEKALVHTTVSVYVNYVARVNVWTTTADGWGLEQAMKSGPPGVQLTTAPLPSRFLPFPRPGPRGSRFTAVRHHQPYHQTFVDGMISWSGHCHCATYIPAGRFEPPSPFPGRSSVYCM